MFSCKSNGQIPIVWGGNNGNLPNNFKSSGNYYYKDIPNYLNNFVGTWEYVNGNEKFQIILSKVTFYHCINNELNYDFYEDGIVLIYKKFLNNNLIFESPNYENPNFRSLDGITLEGSVYDYERVTKSTYYPQILGGGLLKAGGEYYYPDCTIEKLSNSIGQLPKIKFSLNFSPLISGKNRNDIYNGMPTFSIPNDIIMTKVP